MSFPYIPLYSYAITPKYHIILWVIYPIYRYMYICIQCLPLESSTDIQISYIDYKYIHIHIHTCIYIYVSSSFHSTAEGAFTRWLAGIDVPNTYIYIYIYSINIIYPIKKKKNNIIPYIYTYVYHISLIHISLIHISSYVYIYIYISYIVYIPYL
jgi:hypothetical protein